MRVGRPDDTSTVAACAGRFSRDPRERRNRSAGDTLSARTTPALALWLSLSATLLLGVTACGDGSTPPAAAVSASTGPAAGPPRDAPAIDLTQAKAEPCSLLTPADLAGIAVQIPGETILGNLPGPRCAHEQLETGGPRVSVGVNTQSGGIAGLYDRRSAFGVFETGTIDGYPTVNAIPSADPTVCSLSAGVNDTELVFIDLDVGYGPDPELADRCGVAYRLLTKAIQHAVQM